MPNIKVVFWNIENFGSHSDRYGNYAQRCSFIAQSIYNIDADIVMIQELVQPGGEAALDLLLNQLNQAGQDWYCDIVRGALRYQAAAPYSYATNADVDLTDISRYESYAVLWRQNIAKFIMQIADPIDPNTVGLGAGAMIPNTQSNTVKARRVAPNGPAITANITVPAGAGAYALPAGTTIPAGGLITNGAIIPAGVTGVVIPLNPGDILPAGTAIGPGGLTLTTLMLGVNPIVIPAGYNLPVAFTLPAAATVLVPQHALCLVLTGREPLARGGNANFVPGGPNNWRFLNFADGIGAIYNHPFVTRRPATCTIKATLPNAPVGQQLIPITVYHAPLNARPLAAMGVAACSRSMYQAYDHNAGAYIDCLRTVLGGDFNQTLDPQSSHYRAFTDLFGPRRGNAGGAQCCEVIAGVFIPNIRVNNPPPAVAPVYPVTAPPLTVANNPANKSLLGLRRFGWIGNPILSATSDHYRNSCYDNAFFGGFLPAEAPHHRFGDLYFLPDAVSGVAVPQQNFYIQSPLIQMFEQTPVFPLAGGVHVAPPDINNVLNAATLLADIQAGGFGNSAATTNGPIVVTPVGNPAVPQGNYDGPMPLPATVPPQRRAAEFVKQFISDHLPVIFEMNI